MKIFVLGAYYSAAVLKKAIEDAPSDYEPGNFRRLAFTIKEGAPPEKGFMRRQVGGALYEVGGRMSNAKSHQNALGLCLALIEDRRLNLRDHLGLSPKTIFVPVPSRDALTDVKEPKRWGPRDLAKGIDKRGRFRDLVRFREAPAKGLRDAHQLRTFMELIDEPSEDTRSALIVDDVLTSGAHLQAVAMLLGAETSIVHFAGLCVGATVDAPVQDPWVARIIELGPYGRESYDLGLTVG